MREDVTRRPPTQAVKMYTDNVLDGALAIEDSKINGLDFTDTLTLEGWIKPSALVTSYIISKYSFTTNERQYSVTYSGAADKLFFNVSGDGTSGAEFSQFRLDTDLVVGRIYHLAVTFSASTEDCFMYLDGVSQSVSQTIVGNAQTPMESFDVDFCIGCVNNNNTYANFWNGDLWDWRAWDVVRTEAQINDNKYEIAPDERDGLVGRWLASQESGVDESGNGNNMTIIGNPTFTVSDRSTATNREAISSRICI